MGQKHKQRSEKLASQMRRMDAVEALGHDPRPDGNPRAQDAWRERNERRQRDRQRLQSEIDALTFAGLKRQTRHEGRLHCVLPEQHPLLRSLPVAARLETLDPELTKLREYIASHRGVMTRWIAKRVQEMYQELASPGGTGSDNPVNDLVFPILYGPFGFTEAHRDAKQHFEGIRRRHAIGPRKYAHKKRQPFWVQNAMGRLGRLPKRLVYSNFCGCWLCAHAGRFDRKGVYR